MCLPFGELLAVSCFEQGLACWDTLSSSLEMCQLTGACLEDLAVVFATCKTLHMLNLSLITLQREEVKALCTALAHPKCVLRMLG